MNMCFPGSAGWARLRPPVLSTVPRAGEVALGFAGGRSSRCSRQGGLIGCTVQVAGCRHSVCRPCVGVKGGGRGQMDRDDLHGGRWR